jgi:serine/threonine protein kinase/ABC-type branched-subunit amino acid transport system substrate-binding protein
MKCPFCNHDNLPGDDFCAVCGGYLAGSGDATVMAQPPVIAVPPVVNTTPPTVIAPPPPTTTGGRGNTINSRTLKPNDTLEHGRYVVERVIGQGGMGAAVLARDSRLSNKPVVIKELLSDGHDPTQLQEDIRNFKLEVETLASLEHPLIPSVRDSFQEGTRYFMVQDYASGENLEARLERLMQPLPEQAILLYATQVLDILEYLEQQTPPIVHRDIKPANIIVGSKDNRARLVDFGIARAQANKNARIKQTSALGTPGYAPPEQYQGNADGRSDLYALAATMHHLLTNRDPRENAPFVFPLVRSVNSKVSPETERVLDRALKLNPNERYQNAAAMRHDIEGILARRFQSQGDTSSYMRTTSGTMPPRPPMPPQQQPQQQPTFTSTGQQQVRQAPRPAPAQQPLASQQVRQQQQRMQQQQYMQQPQQPVQQQKNRLPATLAIVAILLLVVGASFFVVPRLFNGTTGTPGLGSNSGNSYPPISVRNAGSDLIGISDGSYAFDTNRSNGDLKKQAAEKYRQGDVASALSLMRQAISMDKNDAEAWIYADNYQLKLSNAKYVTVIIGSMPSSDQAGVSVARDNLQGAYIALKQLKDSGKLPNGLKVRTLIASSGKQPANAGEVAKQIVSLTQSDKTVIGVMGWPYSSLSLSAVPILSQAQIPVVSQTASDDALSDISPTFFRVAPPNSVQGVAGAQYARNDLKASSVVIFYDASYNYSQSLADEFAQQFQSQGGKVLDRVKYTVDKPETITSANVQAALQKNPDLIYLAGHAKDANGLLVALDAAKAPASIKVLGGDALYELGGYDVGGTSRARLRFTAFAYPDEWDILGLGGQKPAFFKDYSDTYSGGKEGYGYTRTSADTMLSYDAMSALLNAYLKAANSGSTVGFAEMKTALQQTSFQGVSGWIQFSTKNADPVDKAIVIIAVDEQGRNRMEPARLGKFTK